MKFCKLNVVAICFFAAVNLQVSITSPTYQPCGAEQLSSCTKSLPDFTNPNFMASDVTKDNIEPFCVNIKKSLKCVSRYTRRCMNSQQREHFTKLFHGTELAVNDLCNNATYQDEYLMHAGCLGTIAPAQDNCFSDYQDALKQVTGPNQLNTLCCSFNEYVSCTVQNVKEMCGNDAADFVDGFLLKMTSTSQSECVSVNVSDCKRVGLSDETTSVVETNDSTPTASPTSQTCGVEQLATCSKSLEDILEPRFMASVIKKENFESICLNATESLRCITVYTRMCMSFEQRRHFQKLYRGTALAFHYLCNNATYQDEYLSLARCMRTAVTVETDMCSANYTAAMTQVTTIQSNQVNLVCSALDEYKSCRMQKVGEMCGNDAANFFESILLTMTSAIKNDCKAAVSMNQALVDLNSTTNGIASDKQNEH